MNGFVVVLFGIGCSIGVLIFMKLVLFMNLWIDVIVFVWVWNVLCVFGVMIRLM